uniref:Ribosomal protein L34 n=1 Tax=Gelidium kathyanniae TaxID=2483893 RepID=A0A3G2QXY2_9FLOR|nr:ribosomal protein L34 [Gelidium kathyanniae]AYO27937.1 ribosomal protein L34 [Gelidium kathyanniae]
MSKVTSTGTNRKKLKKSGFRARMKTKQGQRILNSRRKKRRKKIIG